MHVKLHKNMKKYDRVDEYISQFTYQGGHLLSQVEADVPFQDTFVL